MTDKKSLNFIEEIIEKDLSNGKHEGRVHTRFPPEPNGYLHIGHAKAICLNFQIAQQYGGKTNLRFDDTNPTTEDHEFVKNIKNDIHWLGFDWEDREFFASDYFDTLYQYAIQLIEKGKAYVDDSTPEEMAEMKGTTQTPGKNSPYRNRSIEENLLLFTQMKDGQFPDGARVLRAKIDMAHPNMNMRDPVMYRIKRDHHYRTGDEWCIYPMYDFAHGQSDSIEGITHSLCSLEFENHRPLYDWYIKELEIFPSRQIEFARMNVSYMITSKRRLLQLVEQGLVDGWDDPRMPTIAGMRRRGYTPEAIRLFCDKVGIAKRENLIELSLLEFCVRDHLNHIAQRRMCVLRPLPLEITNYPDEIEWVTAENNPERVEDGIREMPFSKHLWIEHEDFMIDAPKKYYRMSPGRYVRLKHAYIIHCTGYEQDESGEVTKVLGEYVENSRSGSDTSGVKAKGTLHWVSQSHAVPVEVRDYDRLFTVEEPTKDEEKDFLSFFNTDSLAVLQAQAEPSLAEAKVGERYQFLRKGYFVLDKNSTDENLIFNLTVGLRDNWKK